MHSPRSSAHIRFGRLAVMGVATLASAVAVAPVAAVANDMAPETPTGDAGTPSVDASTPDPTAPVQVEESEPTPEVDSSETSADDTNPVEEQSEITMPLGLTVSSAKQVAGDQTPAAAPRVAEEMTPTFGFGKQRRYIVDARVADSAFAPDDVTTVGSTFEIVTTLDDGTTTTASCTTVAATIEPQPPQRGFSTCLGETGGNTPLNLFTAPADATRVTITQTKAPEDQPLLIDPDPFVLLPCDESNTTCATTIRSTDFMEPGSILPVTVDDAITVTEGGDPVEVDVLDNDTSDDPATVLTVTDPAVGQGTVRVVENDEGVMVLEYTPPAKFTGDVAITYTVTNSNGSATGTLTVTVEAAEVVVPPTDPPVDNGNGDGEGVGSGDGTDNGDDINDVADAAEVVPSPVANNGTGALPNAGGPGAGLLGIGAMLAVAGSAITLRARRRSSGVHAL